MRTATAARLVAGLAVVMLAAACTSSTDGSGAGSTPPVAGSSTPDSPTAAAPSTVTVTAGAGSSSAVPGTSASSATPSRTPSATVSVRPAPASPLAVATATAPQTKTTYVVKIWAQDRVSNCAAHAYGGPVVAYLRKYGCVGVRRLLATTTVDGKRVGFAQSDVGFRGATVDKSYQAAQGFRQLVTRDGTGNIVDLLREGYRLPAGPTAVPSPDAFSALCQDNSCTVVDAWYLDGPTPENDPALVRMAQDIYLQF